MKTKFKTLTTNLKSIARRTNFKIQKHSPEILMVVGIACGIACTITACKATTKASDIIEKMNDDISDIHELRETQEEAVYSETDATNDIRIIKTQMLVNFAKVYAPSIILGVASITSILASNRITRNRHAALVSAYVVLDTSFKKYRTNVVERFGSETDYELKNNIKTVTTEKVDSETGEVTTETKKVQAEKEEYYSYDRLFDDGCINWKKNATYNKDYLVSVEHMMNERLRIDGFLFLNDVYKALGFAKTRPGQQVGWTYKRNGINNRGDNFVDFGIHDIENESVRAFLLGEENSVWLNFNVDGPIMDILPEHACISGYGDIIYE